MSLVGPEPVQNGSAVWMALAAILNDAELDAAHTLAVPFGVKPHEIPSLNTAIETIALHRQYTQYRDQGEGHWHATVRTSQLTGIPTSTILYRIKKVVQDNKAPQ